MASSLLVPPLLSPALSGYLESPPVNRYTSPVPAPTPYSWTPCIRSGSTSAPPRCRTDPAFSRICPSSCLAEFRPAAKRHRWSSCPVTASWSRTDWSQARYCELCRRSHGGRTPLAADSTGSIVPVSRNPRNCTCKVFVFLATVWIYSVSKSSTRFNHNVGESGNRDAAKRKIDPHVKCKKQRDENQLPM